MKRILCIILAASVLASVTALAVGGSPLRQAARRLLEKTPVYQASEWAEKELAQAEEAALIPEALENSDLTKPITRQEYAAATAEDEGYYLIYTPLGVTKVTDGRQQLNLFVTSRGVVFADLRCMYNRGEEAGTPDKLISPEEAVSRLYQEAARARDRIEIASIQRVALTYVPLRAENKQDGMVFAPVWQVQYHEAGVEAEYVNWAEFNAVDGSMINAIFR